MDRMAGKFGAEKEKSTWRGKKNILSLGKLVPVEQKIIPQVEFFEFFRDDARIGDVVRFYNESHAFTYRLPRSGKDITCRYELSLSFEDAEMKKFVKGDKLDLIWNNGNFSKGAVHW